jgi:flavin reductase (DIM6/NTAB) family NADH-FMN oxidoreductase RutF
VLPAYHATKALPNPTTLKDFPHMFYRPADGHPLPHNPFNAIVTPRPIGWISTQDGKGVANLAPYSFFNGVAYVPPQVMFASTSAKPDQDGTKDSMANIRKTGVFCANVVAEAMKDAMNASSATLGKDVDEFAHAGVEMARCTEIDCPRVAHAPASLECRMTQIVQLEGKDNWVVFGEVVGVHLRDDCIRDGRFDVTLYNPLSRLGYRDYAVIREVFELARPDD